MIFILIGLLSNFTVQQNPKIIMQFRSEKELLLLIENLNN